MIDSQETYDKLKLNIGSVQNNVTDYESRVFTAKQTMDKLRNESDQLKVDLGYAKATAEN